MLVCNYCKRVFKEEYKNCPGCGSDSFEKLEDKLEYVVETPPKGGYKLVGMKEFKVTNKDKNLLFNVIIAIMSGLFFLVMLTTLFILRDLLFTTFIIIPIAILVVYLLILIGLIATKNSIKLDNTKTKRSILQTRGVLYKNLPYEVETKEYKDSDGNLHKQYRIKVVYTLKDGVERTFLSTPKYNSKDYINKNGTADLLIDPNNYDNYYVDLEIY